MVQAAVLSEPMPYPGREAGTGPACACKLAGLLGLALVVRLLFFTGMALGDDVFYATQAVALAESGSWPPEPYHWQTRLGMVLPTALAVKLLGPQPLAFVL